MLKRYILISRIFYRLMHIPHKYLHTPLLSRNQRHVVDYLHILYLVEIKNSLLWYFWLKRFDSSCLKCTDPYHFCSSRSSCCWPRIVYLVTSNCYFVWILLQFKIIYVLCLIKKCKLKHRKREYRCLCKSFIYQEMVICLIRWKW